LRFHYRKLGLVCCLIIACGIVTSGCFVGDILSDMMRTPSVAGDWYNKETKTYISLKDDGKFTMGYGKGNANTGGTYTTDKKEITLHLEYTITADGNKEDWDKNSNLGKGGKIVMPYEFKSANQMLIKSEGGNILYDKIGGESVEVTNANLIGTWDYEKGGLTLVFKEDNQYSIIENTEGSEDAIGNYVLENSQLTLKGTGEDKVFTCEFATKDRLLLTNDAGQFYYERNK